MNDEPLLIVEADNTYDLPLRFRMSTSKLADDGEAAPNLRGFADLRISGSGQFSHNGLRRIRREIGYARATIIDLRQECHGFVNGMAVCWFGRHNNANKGLSNEEAAAKETAKIRALAEAPSFTFDYLEGKSLKRIDEPVTSPKTVMSEQALAEQEGFGYKRFYVTDHHKPSAEEADRFIAFLQALPASTWLHYHCRGGVGRTTTFMLMHDMLRHAKEVALEDILRRHRLNGGRDMYRLHPDPDNYKYLPALERIAFIEDFYQYCLDNRDEYATTWSHWLHDRR